MRISAGLAMMLAHALAQPPQTVTRLAEVKRIFVDSLGDAPGADEMRLKLQNRLSKARNVIVVATPPDADAILKGIAEINRSDRAKIVVQLVSNTMESFGAAKPQLSARVQLKRWLPC